MGAHVAYQFIAHRGTSRKLTFHHRGRQGVTWPPLKKLKDTVEVQKLKNGRTTRINVQNCTMLGLQCAIFISRGA